MATHFMPHRHVPAKQNNLLLVKGVLAMIWGVIALLSFLVADNVLIFSFGLLNIAASILTFSYININRHLEIAHQWLFIEGLTELAAGIIFMLLVKNMGQFIAYMGYGIVFIVFEQFFYGLMLLTGKKLNIGNTVSRFVIAIAGAMVALLLISNVAGTQGSMAIIGGFSVLFGILNAHFALKYDSLVLGKTE